MKTLIAFLFSLVLLLTTSYSQSGWSVQNTGTTNALYSVSFIDGLTGWTAGTAGMIRKTTNGGGIWSAQSSGITSDLYAIKFVSALTGIAAGVNGKILRTTNGGSNWIVITVPATGTLRSIYFINNSTGWICGDAGVILKSSDAGVSWATQVSGITSTLNSLSFSSANSGWAAGETGKILRTTNGGASWQVNADLVSAQLTSISAASDSLIICTGKYTGFSSINYVFFYLTTNAGQWWEYQLSGVNTTLNSLFFINKNYGWVCGDAGVIMGTVNGGTTWINQFTYNPQNLFCINFTSNGVGYCSGGVGSMLKTINNGYVDTILTNRRDLGVVPLVLHSDQLINAKYRVQFKNPDTSFAILRSLNNGVSFDTLYNNLHLDDTGKVFDGILTRVSRIRFNSSTPPGNYTGNCGVISDPVSTPDLLQTRFYGWDYFPPQNKYLEGSKYTLSSRLWQSVSMSLSYPTRNTYVGLKSLLKPEDIRKVKLVFTGYGSGQMAYRYLATSNINYTYQDMREIPLKAYEIDETDGTAAPRQLNCAFLEFPGPAQDNKWEPTADSLGGREILYIFNSNYSSAPDSFYTSKSLFFNQPLIDVMYIWAPKLISAGMTFHVNDEFIIYPYTVTRPDIAPGFPLFYEFTTHSVIGLEPISNIIPRNYSLYQNFPNPFNPQTRIKFDVPAAGTSHGRFVQLKIYDILGREVTTLLNEELKPGVYEVDWNASNYSSGIYFYTLQSGDFSYSRKMILLK